MTLPGSFSLGWLWDSAVLQSAELGVLQVQHGAHYRKNDARSEDNGRIQRKETPSASSSESLPGRYCAPALYIQASRKAGNVSHAVIAFTEVTKVTVEGKALSSGFPPSNIWFILRTQKLMKGNLIVEETKQDRLGSSNTISTKIESGTVPEQL